MRHVILDCTEFYNRPLRTGVQRVSRELLRHWPKSGPELHLARLDHARGLVRLPSEAVALLTDSKAGTSALGLEELQRRLGSCTEGEDIPLPANEALVLLAEIFYDPRRCRFYEERLEKYPDGLAMIAFDFLPFLHPGRFTFVSSAPLMVYLRLISMASSVAFISKQTRQEFVHRVLHVSADDPRIGPVLPLGADGLPIERQIWRRDRRTFLCLGTIEDRKNQHIVVEAFMQLWEAGHGLPLMLIGCKSLERQCDWLDRARTFKQFRWLEKASDDDVAVAMQTCRATVFVSGAEGFGLPAVESLRVGIPVITLADIPSIAMLPPLGQIRLPYASVEAVMGAILHLANDKVAERLWAESARLRLDTWQHFGAAAAEWCANLAEPSNKPKRNVAKRNRKLSPEQPIRH